MVALPELCLDWQLLGWGILAGSFDEPAQGRISVALEADLKLVGPPSDLRHALSF